MSQTDIFGVETDPKWVIFHDESECSKERFLYHGFLFVKQQSGRAILERLRKPDPTSPDNYAKRIHFQELTGLVGDRAKAAVRWVELARDEWLPRGSLLFYCLGVDLANINYRLYQESGRLGVGLPKKKDRVYRRFYEIGLRAALAWFAIPSEQVTYLYYDQGKQDIDRFNKSIHVCGSDTRVEPLHSDCKVSGKDLSKYLQLGDVLLGTVRKAFAGATQRAQATCVDRLNDVMEELADPRRAYNTHGLYYKRLCLNFFPRHNRMMPEEFFARDFEYHRKASDLFYCDRKTHRQREALKAQTHLFDDGG